MDFEEIATFDRFGPPQVQRVAEKTAIDWPIALAPVDRTTPFDPDRVWDKIITDIQRGERPGKTGVYESKGPGRSILAQHLEFRDLKYGITFRQTGDSLVSDMSFTCVASPDRFGGAIRLGGGGKPIAGSASFLNINADGCDRPQPDYSKKNTDFLIVERENAPVFLRYVTAANFSDAIIDAKSDVFIANATLSNSYRELRAHDGATIWIVNSTVSSEDGGVLAWLGGPSASIKYFNVLWDGEPILPLDRVQLKDSSPKAFKRHVIKLEADPLPSLSMLFQPLIETVSIEKKVGSGTWVAMDFDHAGRQTIPFAGDLEVALDLHEAKTIRARLRLKCLTGSTFYLVSEPRDFPAGPTRIDLLDFAFQRSTD